jgi:Ca2+-transporting ATPase
MVLADDNFATIVHAVRGGRAIFRNIQKFIFFLNSSNAGLVLAVIAGAFIPWMPALMPIQLLWINLVTNGLPALALGLDPPERSQMREPPRPVAGAIVGWRDMGGVALVGCVLGLSALAVFFLPDLLPRLFSGERATALHEARTMAFAVLALGPMFHAFNARSPRESILTLGLFTNRLLWGAIAFSAGACVLTIVVPALRPIFHTTSLAAAQWGVVLALSFLPLPVVEIGKLIDRWAHSVRGAGPDAKKIRLSPADVQNR